MPVKVIMPHMGESVVEGTILKWLKREGEMVARDEPLVEVSTDKVDVEVPSPASGVLIKVLAREGETLPVGTELALIGEVPEKLKEEAVHPEREAALLIRGYPDRETPEPSPIPSPPKKFPAEKKRKVTPVVAKLADKHGIDLDMVKGTGIGGRITKKDILAYLAKGRPSPPELLEPVEPPKLERPPQVLEPYDVVPLTGMRKAIAEHMAMSKRTSPHVTTVAEVDMTRLVAFRERHKEEFEATEGFPLTYMPFIVKATVNALKEFPYLNASLEGDRIILKRYYHIGIAVALEEGLIVPVIKHADQKDIRVLARAIHDLASRARAKRISLEELQGGTFSITNPGVFGAILSTPIIHQPQVAILGVEAIRKMPVVRDEQIVIRSIMYLCLSYDHRIVDGATAVQFLQRVRRYLENPLDLIL